jgi:hypothetical protein
MMATADLITDFLGNEMSPERERQFLLSVAASDALRLELKSHLMVDRILVDRVQTARVPETVRSTIFAAAGVATGHAAPEAPTSSAPAVDRVAAPRTSFFSRLGGRVTLVAAACAFFGAGYFVGNDGDVERAVNAQSAGVVTRSAPATSSPSVARDAGQSAPRIVDVEPGSSTVAGASSRSRSGSGSVDAARPSSRASADAGRTSGALSTTTNSPAIETPAATTQPSRPNRNRIITTPQPVGVVGSIRKPTEAEREQQNNTNPLENGGETPVR